MKFNLRKNSTRGFELGGVLLFLTFFFLIVAGIVYKYFVPIVKNAPADRTPNIEVEQKPSFWGGYVKDKRPR